MRFSSAEEAIGFLKENKNQKIRLDEKSDKLLRGILTRVTYKGIILSEYFEYRGFLYRTNDRYIECLGKVKIPGDDTSYNLIFMEIYNRCDVGEFIFMDPLPEWLTEIDTPLKVCAVLSKLHGLGFIVLVTHTDGEKSFHLTDKGYNAFKSSN